MSLDDRLRSGLQTLAKPTEDTQHALEAFRERAYPRRARRRIVQAIAGTIAAAAIIAGATTAVVSSAKKSPGFVTPIPSNIPPCGASDIQAVLATEGPVVSGRSNDYYVTYQVFSTGAACRVDETIAPTFTASIIEYGPLHNGAAAPSLQIQGNGSPGRLAGVVPEAQENSPLPERTALSISWAWTNWCGSERSFSVSFRRVSGSTDVIHPEGSTATLPVVPTCNDPALPSTVTVIPASTEPFPSIKPSGWLDLNPHLIAPRPGLTNLTMSYVDQVTVEPDGRTLLVSFVHGDQCSIFARIDSQESANAVRLSVYVGDLPDGPTCMGGGHAGDATKIVLKQPLGRRRLIDGADPTHSIPVAHLTKNG